MEDMGLSHFSRSRPESAGQRRMKLGVIGGMGPAATAYFYQLLTELAHADTDQDHLEAIIISKPSIPDRTAFITGKSANSPAADIIEAGRILASMGADYIAIPCVTSHYFYDELAAGISAPIIHMVRESALAVKKSDIDCVGILATDGTLQSRALHSELEALGIKAVVPPPNMQEQVMDLIYNCVKAGKPADAGVLMSIGGQLLAAGARRVLLACTELSLINRDSRLPREYVDILEILAARSLELCGKRVKINR